MDASDATMLIYKGEAGYVTVTQIEHNGKQGAILFYANPDPRKLHAVDSTGMQEMYSGLEAIEVKADELTFCIFNGAYDPVHAGADITEFAGNPDYDSIKAHLYRGTELDTRVKGLWPKLRTVAIFCGDRYGGSVEWPLFAEWGVADDKTRIQFSEVTLGIVPGWNGLLNTWLKSNGMNALYMGSTGNAVNAERMRQMGLIQQVVETPDPPDRRAVIREEWPAAWASYAEICQQQLQTAALDLATLETEPTRQQGYDLITEDALKLELARRMDPAPYRKLRDAAAKEAAALDPTTQKEDLKALNKRFTKELLGLGKPLAPKAVGGVAKYVGEWGNLSTEELLTRFDEIGHLEADLCAELMHTDHRRIGVGAVLARDPADRIPVFE